MTSNIADWEQVPALVRERYQPARAAKLRWYKYASPEARKLPAYWNRNSDTVRCVTSAAERLPGEGWIKLAGGALGWLHKPFEWGGALTGGPSPLSDSLVGATLGGLTGYGAGTVMEHMFPEEYVERGRLRKTLGLVGAGVGAWPGLFKGVANTRNAGNAAAAQGERGPGSLRMLLTPHEKVPLNRGAIESDYHRDREREYPQASPAVKAAAAAYCGLLKLADMSAGGLGLHSVPVDAFNRAIWNDVRKGELQQNIYGTKDPFGDNSAPLHTPPPVGAAASGLVTGIQQMYGNPTHLTTHHFVHGLAAAGADLATAYTAGRVLGVLGGLSPGAQNKLQNMGLWGGFIRGVTGSVLGIR